ncbi:MAG: thioredoxin domain-containing protein, partial [Thermoplasmata archaeon]|nr:thioredoxin domain-containing protein [Thermoplasmata archaeon]
MPPPPSEPAPPAKAHRLANAASVYLRSAAEQSIDWHPWGTEPFALARRLRRPVLIDIGAVWCHWCHVMDEGTYSDPEVARLLAEGFVAVKVDRDENPEVDRRFQRQVNAITGEGGWPLTAFATPEGEVFLGGTYFPPEDGMGRPGFRRVLREAARLYHDEPEKVRQNADVVRGALTRMSEGRVARAISNPEFLARVRTSIHESYDPVHGGFGQAPKFPHAGGIEFLLLDGFQGGDPRSAARAIATLHQMVDGGIFDQVGGGFHRYSVDEGWHVPHFEKMGADNAELLAALVEVDRQEPRPRFADAIGATVRWVSTVLADPAGGFGASQDADNAPGDDGGYFTWSRPELKAVLGADDLRLVVRTFGVGTDGRMPHDPDRNVFYRLMSDAELASDLGVPEAEARRRLDAAVAKLAEARGRRPSPLVDRTLYAEINGLFLRAFARAGRASGSAAWLTTARRAADRFLRDGYAPEAGVVHRLGGPAASGHGLLADQAAMALGLVELAGATVEPRYATAASALLDLVDREFRADHGLLRDVAPGLYDGPKVGSVDEPAYPLEDTPNLAPNAAVAIALLRLAALTGNDSWRERARPLVAAMAARLGPAGLFAGGAAFAAGALDVVPARVVVEGTGPDAERLARTAERTYHPNLWVFRGVPPPPFSLPDELGTGGHAARALVCFGTRCLAPVTEPVALVSAIRSG